MRIQTFDTTLRDGTQGEAVSFSVDDKLLIARKLDELGIDEVRCNDLGLRLFKIGCPWPISRQDLMEFSAGLDLIMTGLALEWMDPEGSDFERARVLVEQIAELVYEPDPAQRMEGRIGAA